MKDKLLKKVYCKQPIVKPTKFPPNISEERKSFILSGNKKWVNGTDIKYFFTGGAENQRKVVRDAFTHWKKLGIGISFSEVNSIEASICRIGFDYTDGSWSYVGRDNLTISITKNTMNFGWDLTENPYGMTTALHEIGHLIGFQHEHQSPFSGIEWNTNAVYRAFQGSPNYWSKKTVDHNILNKMPPNQVIGSTWDPKSIMQYEFDAGLILNPEPYNNGLFPPGILSENDIQGIRKIYPILTTNSKQIQKDIPLAINAQSGFQEDYEFEPEVTKKYTFETNGSLDTVMVIWEIDGTEKHYLSGDDDTGTDTNSKIILPLIKGRKYLVNVKVVYAANNQTGTLTIS